MKRTWILLLFCSVWTISVFADQVHHYTLKNGLKLFVKVNFRAPVVVSQVWYKVGSSDELNGITGISHALEHMMFQGTKKYPSGVLSKMIERHGGVQNAMTGPDFTMYYQELPSKNLELSFQLESDRMKNLSLLQSRFDKEIQVVQEERRLRTDNDPKSLTFERFQASAYIANPYHHPIVGWMDDIKQLTVSDLRAWYKARYAPNNALLVVAGDVEPKAVYKLVKKYFGKIQPQVLPESRFKKDVPFIGKREVEVNIPAKLPFLVMGYNVPVLNTEKETWKPYALTVLAFILSGGESARIEKEMVRGRQIAAWAGASYALYSKLSNLFMFIGVPSQHHSVNELENAFLEQVDRLKTKLVSSEELERVKVQVVAFKIFSRDSLFAQAYEIGSLESIGLSWREGENFVSQIEKVTPKQIQLVAREFLTSQRLTVARLNPAKQS